MSKEKTIEQRQHDLFAMRQQLMESDPGLIVAREHQIQEDLRRVVAEHAPLLLDNFDYLTGVRASLDVEMERIKRVEIEIDVSRKAQEEAERRTRYMAGEVGRIGAKAAALSADWRRLKDEHDPERISRLVAEARDEATKQIEAEHAATKAALVSANEEIAALKESKRRLREALERARKEAK